MKLTGELKAKVSKADTKEEKKDIIAQAGMELTDGELEMVTGGGMYWYSKVLACNSCPYTNSVVPPGFEIGQMYECPSCHKMTLTIQGEQYND